MVVKLITTLRDQTPRPLQLAVPQKRSPRALHSSTALTEGEASPLKEGEGALNRLAGVAGRDAAAVRGIKQPAEHPDKAPGSARAERTVLSSPLNKML